MIYIGYTLCIALDIVGVLAFIIAMRPEPDLGRTC